jgi:hypothetical protein
MFRPNGRTVFRLIFEKEDCTIDNVLNLRVIALRELVKITLVCSINDLRLKFECGIFIQ